jgi:hypothetical protein
LFDPKIRGRRCVDALSTDGLGCAISAIVERQVEAA